MSNCSCTTSWYEYSSTYSSSVQPKWWPPNWWSELSHGCLSPRGTRPCRSTVPTSEAGTAVRVGRLRPRGGVVAATAACRDRIRLPTRALSLRRDPSLVAHGRSSSSSQPLAAATCPCRPCDPVFHPPAPPHHPCVMERRCPAAGGVKHARGGVRQGVMTHHRLCRPAPMMAKDLHPPHVLVWLLEPRECVCAAYICPT